LERWLLKGKLEGEFYEGIKIVDASLRRDIDKRFCVNTVAALRLIESLDPRRFRRVQREIKYVLNCEDWRWAYYTRALRCCNIDYGSIDDTGNEEWYLRYYASTLVHEATHGAIYSRCIDYTRKLRPRIERLCHLEEKRFTSKFDTADRHWSKELVRDFDEQDWKKYWHSKFSQRFKESIARWHQSWKSVRAEKAKHK